jgi:hypothetical protein
MADDGKGGKKPIKIGLAPVQREGMEYEFTSVIDLSVEGHIATVTKDRTPLFDGEHFVPSAKTGAAFRDWLTAGKDPVAESKRIIEALKASTARIASVPELATWWRSRSAEIALLTPSDREALTGHCAARKLAILEAAATAQPATAPEETDDTPKRRGNGDDRSAAAAGIEALKAAANR